MVGSFGQLTSQLMKHVLPVFAIHVVFHSPDHVGALPQHLIDPHHRKLMLPWALC